jgi:hypothetical protein
LARALERRRSAVFSFRLAARSREAEWRLRARRRSAFAFLTAVVAFLTAVESLRSVALSAVTCCVAASHVVG